MNSETDLKKDARQIRKTLQHQVGMVIGNVATPGWYRLLRVARYMRVAPWELEQHPEWIELAEIAMKVERDFQEKRCRTSGHMTVNAETQFHPTRDED